MEGLFGLLFKVLAVPNIQNRKPSWLVRPPAMVVFSLAIFTYFLITAGVVYDVIVEPPSVGSRVDERGISRPVPILPHRINGQYIMEGLASSFFFTLGGLGFIILYNNQGCGDGPYKLRSRLAAYLIMAAGFICILVSVFTTHVFMKIKVPGYLSW